MTTPPDRLVAALADRCTIERELGSGGMATVYLAEDLKHKRKVAVRTGFLERTLDEKDHAIGRTGWLGADRLKSRVPDEESQ